MTAKPTSDLKANTCKSCSYVIRAGAGFRCGFEYFQIPAQQRRPPKLTTLTEVGSEDSCERWSSTGSAVLKPVASQTIIPKTRQMIYYLPGHGGLIGTGLGQALLDMGCDVTGRETVDAFKELTFQDQINTVASDLKSHFWHEDAKVIANSFGAYLFLHAQAQINEPYVGNVILLSPIVGEFSNEDTLMNFIPPRSERLFELAKAGVFPAPLKCEIHTGSEDWQSNPKNVLAFGEMVGVNVTVVNGAGHMLPKDYVSDLLIKWLANYL